MCDTPSFRLIPNNRQPIVTYRQGQPLGGASGALAQGADFEGAPKRQSPTGHTLIRSTVAWWFPHFQTKGVAKDFFFKFGCIGFSLFWCILAFKYEYSRYALCLLLQILLVAVLDIKTRDVSTVSSINSLLSQYCKASLFFANFYIWGGGAPTVWFAPVVPWAKTGPAYRLICLFYSWIVSWNTKDSVPTDINHFLT
jgi:hypothetical protein